jgi:glycosyltransferase involved in cell wall biosynthesis
MKILAISNLYPPGNLGGYELGCKHVVEALRSTGHEVEVLTTPAAEVSADPDYVLRELQLAPVYNPNRVASQSTVERCQALARGNFVTADNVHVLVKTLEGFDPDVVYLWNLYGLGGLGIVCCLSGTSRPWVWHLMDTIPAFLCGLASPHTPGEVAHPAIARQFSELISGRYIVCSQRILDEADEQGVTLRDSVTIIPNWISGPAPPKRTEFYRGGHLRLIYTGQLGHHKGTDILIDAAATLVDRGYANFAIDLYGIGDSSLFQSMVNGRELRGIVNFHGPLDQGSIIPLYDHHDVFVFPTWRREPFGFAPLEAAGRGCVPLVSGDSGFAEWFVDGVHCIKSARDSTSFATQVGAVIDQRIDLPSIARRTQATVGTDFHLDTLLPRIEKVLSDAADERSDARSANEFYAIARLAEGVIERLVAKQ